MSDSTLTAETPVAPEVLAQLGKLQDGYQGMASHLTEMELAKIRLMVRIRAVMEERDRIIERELVARGLAPNTQVQIDDTTGAITVLPSVG